jgi:hypothetical protein
MTPLVILLSRTALLYRSLEQVPCQRKTDERKCLIIDGKYFKWFRERTANEITE